MQKINLNSTISITKIERIMKVTMARIRLYLKEGKTLSDGSNPIMLMVSFNGRKELSTGFSCVPRFFDKKGECVKKGYPNYAAINSAILKMKNDAISRRNEFERLGIKYTPKMVLEECRESLASNGEITSLVESLEEESDLVKYVSVI